MLGLKKPGDALRKREVLFYGVGHFYNDLSATLWFYYMSYFLTDIVKIPTSAAGVVLLVGQVADAVGTLLSGVVIDKTNTRLGKSTPWYVGATIVQCFTFYFLYRPADCYFVCNDNLRTVYYVVLGGLFNVTWAIINVAHYSLPPMLSFNWKMTDKMVDIRTSFVFLAQFSSLLGAFVITFTVSDKFLQFSLLSKIILGVGVAVTALFVFNVDEKRLSDSKEELLLAKQEESKEEDVSFTFWLSKGAFWTNLLVFVFVKLSVNVTTVMLPYYLDKVVGFSKGQSGAVSFKISIVMCLLNVGSLMNNCLFFNKLKCFFCKKTAKIGLFSIGFVCSLVGNLPLYFLDAESCQWIYLLIVIIGFSFSTGINISCCEVNYLVGLKCDQGGFVYGFFSCTEKFLNGIFFYIALQATENDVWLLKSIVSLFPCFIMLLAAILLAFQSLNRKEKVKDCRKNSKSFESGSFESYGNKEW